MTEPGDAAAFDVVVVGAGSAGAVVAARLSEDPACRVCLLEAGGQPPPEELVPGLAAATQLNPATDWMYTADPGRGGLGLMGRRVPVPRGRMLGGTSAMNYMAYVRGHPGDFDAWAEAGAAGWSYAEVLPYFRKSEAFVAPPEALAAGLVVDPEAHGTDGPMGVTVRSPLLPVATQFVEAARAAGFVRADHNGRHRGGAAVVSLAQLATRDGRRASTYRAFLEGEPEKRANLTVLTEAQATRVLLEGRRAVGVEFRAADGSTRVVRAAREIVLSAGAIGSPHLLMLSGIGPRSRLEAAGVPCLVDSPHVGRHLMDHVLLPLLFPAPGIGVPVREIERARSPEGLAEWRATGRGLLASTLADAIAFFATGLGGPHTHDGQVGIFPCNFTPEFWRTRLRIEPGEYLRDPATQLAPDAESLVLLPQLAKPRSEGEVVLRSADPMVHPEIRMNYFTDDHDLATMVAIARRALEIAACWPAPHALGPLQVPPFLAERHGHAEGAAPSDGLLGDLALHYALTVYHHSCTARIGDVVDPRLRVFGVNGLRVADTSVMPDIVSGNTNAAAVMIGEKAAELVAADHRIRLGTFVGPA